ncbi:hypothetical protein [Microbacterium sp.]|uniref:hypothetical protein n=1 Tax=Microbacterium sp. TaxID=51671 RepID=UPI0025EFC84C|nr:hypothetical protein [Microbacterium sp.]
MLIASTQAKGTIMTNSAPAQDPAGRDPETQTPTPSPSSGADAGEFTQGTAEKPEQAESPEDADPAQVPSNEELEEPSTEKEPEEEPKAPAPDDAEPDHRAVGIGVIDAPESDAGE